MELLFAMAHWHGLAKLRMHHDLLLDFLDGATGSLGLRLRQFSRKTCTAFDTKELQREYNARIRREAKQAARSNRPPENSATRDNIDMTTAHGEQNTEPVPEERHRTQENLDTGTDIPAEHQQADSETMLSSSETAATATTRNSGRRRKTLNINTYKFHSYGDYARTIRTHGTMDSYSTEPVSNVRCLVTQTRLSVKFDPGGARAPLT